MNDGGDERKEMECKRLCEKPQWFWVINQNMSGDT